MSVLKADQIKAIEKTRRCMRSCLGDTPTYTRKRSIYRALKRKDTEVCKTYAMQLRVLDQVSALIDLLNGKHYER